MMIVKRNVRDMPLGPPVDGPPDGDYVPRMTQPQIQALVRSCDEKATRDDAMTQPNVRVWREIVDKRTGEVIRSRPIWLSGLTLALNRLYVGRGLSGRAKI